MIVVYGTVCLDRILRIASFPQPSGYAEVLGEERSLGGEAANTAVALRKWGAEVALVGNSIGSGPDAEYLLDQIRLHGLSAEGVPTESGSTPHCDIFVTSEGLRTMFGTGFAAMAKCVEPYPFPLVEGAWFTADPNHGAGARAALRRAHAAGMRTYAMDFVREDEPWEAIDFWQSSTDWTGVRGDFQANVAWVEDFVRAHGVPAVLTDGPFGYVYGSPDERARRYDAVRAPVVIDTTGAGDVFRAGMLFGLAQGWAVMRCLKFASAAAAIKCRAHGAVAGIPRLEEVYELLAGSPTEQVELSPRSSDPPASA